MTMRPDSSSTYGWELKEKYHYLLHRLDDELTVHNMKDLQFLCDIKDDKMQHTNSGKKLFQLLESEGELSETNIVRLYSLFEGINRRDLINKLDEYRKFMNQIIEKKQIEESRKVLGTTVKPGLQKQINAAKSTKKTSLPGVTVDKDLKLMSPKDFSKPSGKKIPHESTDEEYENRRDIPRLFNQGAETPIMENFIQRFNSVLSPTPPGTIPQCSDMENETSQLLMPSRFKGLECYKMDAIPRGKCLIISNFIFEQARENHGLKLMDRPGTRIDEEHLVKTFQWLGFDVELYRDLTSLEIWEVMQRVANLDHSSYDCFVCCMLSHGDLDVIYGVDGLYVPLHNLYPLFNKKTLLDKPKVFFFQACRGDRDDKGISEEEPLPKPIQRCYSHDGMQTQTVSVEADYFIGYATPPGYKAWIHEKEGSWYINALCVALQTHAKTHDIHQICTEVNKLISSYCVTPEGQKQIPCPSYTLTKSLYFFPNELINPVSAVRSNIVKTCLRD